MTSKYKENDVGAENSGEEEDADSGNAKDGNSANKDEELSLDEVLHLGGTRVSFLNDQLDVSTSSFLFIILLLTTLTIHKKIVAALK